MSLSCGIVGLPNVGKSTIFNAITNTTNAESANYPFCTIEPNSGIVKVFDERLEKLATFFPSEKIINNTIEIIDIAGLVKGASKGEGLGNQFLGNIRQVDAILHVVRCFENDDIIHVCGQIDPINDIEIIETELLLSDITSIEKRIANIEKKAKNDKDLQIELDVLKKILPKMNEGAGISSIDLTEDENEALSKLQLITTKPVIYICNTDEAGLGNDNKFVSTVKEYAQKKNRKTVKICAQIESEMSEFSLEDKKNMLEELGVPASGLEILAKAAFDTLNLITFFTIGPKEARAWSVIRNSLAPQAAGVIHTDFEKGFIKAETISYQDYVDNNGEAGARNTGKLRLEGKSYVVQDGDVMHFKFNV